jgi:hypothetical protein
MARARKPPSPPPSSDPFWVDFTLPLAQYLAGGPRTWAQLREWAKERRMGHNWLLEGLAWLSAHDEAGWDKTARTWSYVGSAARTVRADP